MSSTPNTVTILMKRRHGTDESTVHAVYSTPELARQRVQRIANHKDNRQFKMREVGADRWVIGPDYDPGFFGQKPMDFWLVTKELKESL